MRVLWFTGAALPTIHHRLGIETKSSGYWQSELLQALSASTDLRIAVACALPGFSDRHFRTDGVDYYVMGQRTRKFSLADFHGRDLVRCAELIESWKPDMVHVHGTERFYGLLGADKHVAAPVLISLQGFLNPYLRYFWGNLKIREIMGMHSVPRLICLRGWLRLYMMWRCRAKIEKQIIKENSFFAGRTAWDRAQVRAINPRANYFQVGEVLRPEFFDTAWSLDTCDRHTLFFSNANEPRRGVECLLTAAGILKNEFPDIRVRLARVDKGSGYAGYLKNKIAENGLSGHIELFDYLGVESIVRRLAGSHGFVLPSYIENSPNSLCEAQLVGTPCISSYAGGIPSLVEHGKTGLLFPAGDAPMLAERIRTLFLNDGLAKTLGRNARLTATPRHSAETVVRQMMRAYESVLAIRCKVRGVTSLGMSET